MKKWHVNSYFKLPNRKRKLLTEKFLKTLQNEIIKIYVKSHQEFNYEKENYYSFYSQIVGTIMFDDALKNTCKIHNLNKAIYLYASNLNWYDRDYFDSEIILEMVNKKIINKE